MNEALGVYFGCGVLLLIVFVVEAAGWSQEQIKDISPVWTAITAFVVVVAWPVAVWWMMCELDPRRRDE